MCQTFLASASLTAGFPVCAESLLVGIKSNGAVRSRWWNYNQRLLAGRLKTALKLQLIWTYVKVSSTEVQNLNLPLTALQFGLDFAVEILRYRNELQWCLKKKKRKTQEATWAHLHGWYGLCGCFSSCPVLRRWTDAKRVVSLRCSITMSQTAVGKVIKHSIEIDSLSVCDLLRKMVLARAWSEGFDSRASSR